MQQLSLCIAGSYCPAAATAAAAATHMVQTQATAERRSVYAECVHWRTSDLQEQNRCNKLALHIQL
jgi:hypothetical protein